jgi:hypothetical protein
MPVFRDYSQTSRTAENGLLGRKAVAVPAFLRKAHAQSGFAAPLMGRNDESAADSLHL